MEPNFIDSSVTLWHGDSLEVLRELPDESIDAVVTDPPYNLSFMAKPWDAHDGQEDAGFAYWLAGLIDGEGHFAIKRHTRGTHAPYFQLRMRADERGTLERIRRTLGTGTIVEEEHEPNPMVKFSIGDKAGCQRLVDLLDKYPLRAKKQIDYWTWREAVCEWTNRPRGNRWHGAADNSRMAGLRERLMETRRYSEVAWSGHEFQDWCRLWATECLRVLKPGGHLLAFGGSRTWHRLQCGIEDAGFEIRDSIAWLYGSGFPKSLDVSKAIDKSTGENRARQLECTAWMRTTGLTAAQINAATSSFMGSHYLTDGAQAAIPTAGMFDLLRPLLPEVPERIERLVAERTGIEWTDYVNRPVLRERFRAATGRAEQGSGGYAFAEDFADTSAATEASARWQGWGTALKPAFEPIVVARKPLGGGADIRARIEYELRLRGVEGEIRWRTRPASGADSLSPMPTSGSTGQQPMAAMSARTVSGCETQRTASATARRTGKPADVGGPTTPSTPAPSESDALNSSEMRCSMPTEASAPAAESAFASSSPSTTSAEAERLTEKRPGARSTSRSSAKASRPATESFAGIATGLTGWASVRIDRLADGSFVWPDGLPEVITGGSTVAGNVLAHGTGALNIDACRIDTHGEQLHTSTVLNDMRGGHYGSGHRPGESSAQRRYTDQGATDLAATPGPRGGDSRGRWPANVILDEHQAALLDQQTGDLTSGYMRPEVDHTTRQGDAYGQFSARTATDTYGDTGGASRFFLRYAWDDGDWEIAQRFYYLAKADSSERVRVNGVAHPTVKPLELMRWLVRLVTPPGGLILEPFAGSGTTVEACLLEGMRCVAIEREADYLPLIRQRIDRRRDPVAAIVRAGDDAGLFGLLDGGGVA